MTDRVVMKGKQVIMPAKLHPKALEQLCSHQMGIENTRVMVKPQDTRQT